MFESWQFIGWRVLEGCMKAQKGNCQHQQTLFAVKVAAAVDVAVGDRPSGVSYPSTDGCRDLPNPSLFARSTHVKRINPADVQRPRNGAGTSFRSSKQEKMGNHGTCQVVHCFNWPSKVKPFLWCLERCYLNNLLKYSPFVFISYQFNCKLSMVFRVLN